MDLDEVVPTKIAVCMPWEKMSGSGLPLLYMGDDWSAVGGRRKGQTA